MGALKPLKPLKPIVFVAGAGAGTVGLPNPPKNPPPTGLATSVGVEGTPKSGPVVEVAVVPGA